MTNFRSGRLIATATLIGAFAASGAQAQQAAAARPTATAPAPVASAPLPPGPNIAGVCVFSTEQTIATSAVGKFVGTRLQQLQTQANAELGGEATSLQNDAKALDAQRATLATDVLQQRALTLQQRDQSLQRKAEVRQRELQATQEKAFARIATEFNPLLRQVYQQKNCSLLLDRNAVFAANASMDVTADVVRLLDGRITQFQFDRERLDQPATAAATAPRQ